MAKYLILYNSSERAGEIMAKSSSEEKKAGMQAWIDWKEEAEKSVKFDFGMPVQAIRRLTTDGETESDSMISGYSLMEGDEGAVLAALKTHPHFNMGGASIDILEVIAMDGM